MRRDEKLLAILAGLTLGPLLIFVACTVLRDLPTSSELITVSSHDVMTVKYSYYQRRGQETPRMCFLTRWDCVFVAGEQAHFAALASAVARGQPYSIGFVQASELFSDSTKRYNMVYAVNVNGRPIKSLDDHVIGMRIFMGVLIGLGAAAIAWSVRGTRDFLRPRR